MKRGKNTEPAKGCSSSVSFRNLRKADLGGVIFGCTHLTKLECLHKQIFGLPGQHFSYVRNIEPGLPLFLFNYSDRMLHGVYEAASHGQLNIDPYAWTQDGTERTQYPAQVRIYSKMSCQPLPEKDFRSVIKDNYYHNRHFYFELDHTQVKYLISLFTPSPHVGQSAAPVDGSARKILVPHSTKKEMNGFSKSPNSGANLVHDPSALSRNKPLDALCPPSLLDDEEHPGDTMRMTPIADIEGSGAKELLHDMTESWFERGGVYVPLDATRGTGQVQTISEFPEVKEVENLDRDLVLEKLKKLAFQNSSLNAAFQTFPEGLPGSSMHNCPTESTINSTQEENGEGTDLIPMESVSMQMLKAVTQRMVELEKKQATADRELDQLRKDSDQLKKDSDCKISKLQERVNVLEAELGLSLSGVKESWNEFSAKKLLGSESSIYLIGGYDGSSWLDTLDSYSPSLDVLTHLQPMRSVRSYAAVAALSGCIYIFGGGDGIEWYDTVECYNSSCDEWILQPPLLRRKGSLAGATINGKIFAVGGGDGVETFSDVEMLDPLLGRWMNCQPMLQKRFAPAASEYNGALYTVGGYDGQSYLNSAERYDPREAFWNPLPCMKSRRGCHSLAVFHDKLYALGGYDGETMVSTVEVFDLRSSSWITCESMNRIRGYAGSAVLGDSLFVIGGVENGTNAVDVVECYAEGMGWVVTGLKAVGKRCFFSAITL